MAAYSAQTSERTIQAIINAGKFDTSITNDAHYKNLEWPDKLSHLIHQGILDEDLLVGLFAKTVSLPRAYPALNEIDASALTALPYKYLIEHSVLPYQFDDGFLKVLIIDPRSTSIKNELKEKSQYDIIFEITSLTHFESIMNSAKINEQLNKLTNNVAQEPSGFIETFNIGGTFGLDSNPASEISQKVFETEKPKELDEILDASILEKPQEDSDEVEISDSVYEKPQDKVEKPLEVKAVNAPKATNSRPALATKTLKEKWNVNDPDLVIDFCNQILYQAVQEDISDIHIEAFRDFANIRMRKDGVMQIVPMYSAYLFKNYAAVTTRFKILADCDIAEKRLPQDGAITIKDGKGGEVDFRFSVMPTKNGERIVMRILAGDPALSLDKIGFDPEDYEKVVAAITAPQGMVLVTGPTGSGKTTTLYGALQYINRPDINILTAEDPVEYYLEGAGQVQANEKIGLTFSSILRAFLRQDPEVILVGEIRDQETIDIAIKAALTGHLLLSTLHTNDAISTISRILNMGVPNFMISSAVSLIIAQRLARKNCPACSEDDPKATPDVLKKLGFTGDLNAIHAKHGVGCKQCEGKGFKGRRGIYEVLRITKPLEEAILRNEQAPALLKAAKLDGFRTMQEIGRDLIAQGILSIEEFQTTLNLENH